MMLTFVKSAIAGENGHVKMRCVFTAKIGLLNQVSNNYKDKLNEL